MTQKPTVDFELMCVDIPHLVPPDLKELRLGVQARKEVQQDAACPAEQIVFRFPLQVVIDPRDGELRFSGDYVHGPRGEQFIYLCWGTWVEGEWLQARRAKLPLNGLERERVEEALLDGQPVRARVHMTDARGQPAAATLKPGAYEWL